MDDDFKRIVIGLGFILAYLLGAISVAYIYLFMIKLGVRC